MTVLFVCGVLFILSFVFLVYAPAISGSAIPGVCFLALLCSPLVILTVAFLRRVPRITNSTKRAAKPMRRYGRRGYRYALLRSMSLTEQDNSGADRDGFVADDGADWFA
jgi:hypothetical protein